MGSTDGFLGSDGSGLRHWQKGLHFTWPTAKPCKRLLAFSEALCKRARLTGVFGTLFIIIIIIIITSLPLHPRFWSCAPLRETCL